MQLARFDTPYGIFFAFQDDLITRQLEEFGAHTRTELAMLLSMVRKGDRIIDIGAHIGTFTVPLARAAGKEGRVLSVEPQPEALSLLRKNVAANDLDSEVAVVEALIGQPAGGFRPLVELGNTAATYYLEDTTCGQVRCLSLDELWLQRAKRRPIDLVKIDTEGMEISILGSGPQFFESCRPILYLEVVESHLRRYGHEVEELGRWLASKGYSLFRNRGRRNSGDDTFEIVSLPSLEAGGTFFDCLAVPTEKAKPLGLPD